MIINKVIQSLAKNCSADRNIRPTLASVYFTKNKAVATDSIKMCEIEFIQNEMTQNELKMPNFEYKKYDENLLISKDDILKISIPKTKTEIFNNVYISNNNEWVIKLKSYEWNFSELETKQVKWEFPDYKSFYQNDWNLEVWVWVNEMIELLQIYKKADIKNVRIKLWSPLQPILITENWNKYKLEQHWIKAINSILMPVKLINN